MNVTLTLQDLTKRIYNLDYDLRIFKGMITRAINKKNIGRLEEAESQLKQQQNNSDAKFELARIQAFLKKQNPQPHIEGQKITYQPKDMITDIRYFSRSESHKQFDDSSAFAMKEPKYFSTYHRSESCRMFSVAGGRKSTQFSSPCTKKRPNTQSYSAHSGNIHSPFSLKTYQNAFTLEKQAEEGLQNIRDHSLLYRHEMAKLVAKSFSEHQTNQQKVRKPRAKEKHDWRPIVYVENQYPCVLISLPILNPMETKTEAAKYWSKHPKPFQKLLISCLIALVNAEAFKANIPIEMVLRASFGHNSPSVCQTNNTFRINTGIIPQCYAKLIGKALHQLNQLINNMANKEQENASLDNAFHKTIRRYNAKKLKDKISTNNRYHSLRDIRCYKTAEESEARLKELHEKFEAINKEKGRKGSSTMRLVNLANKSIWDILRSYGDTLGNSVLAASFREKGTTDWFASKVLESILSNSNTPIQDALTKLIKCMEYGETASMNYSKIHEQLKQPKRVFKNLSFKRFYDNDKNFDHITKLLFEGFSTQRPDHAIYAELEHAGTEFSKTARGSTTPTEEPDYGSDSECEGDLTDIDEEKKQAQILRPRKAKHKKTTHHFLHKKLRVCSGMKAILIAQYTILSYLLSQGHKKYTQEIKQMYYEVADALKLVETKQPALDKVNATIGSSILHFDLNHCNSSNAANNKTLQQSLDAAKPNIVLLDYTSATQLQIQLALRQCFSDKNIKVVFLVDSGLKNNQNGLDLNPYGEVRVYTRDRQTQDDIFKHMRTGLGEQDKLPQIAHEKIRANKRRGTAYSFSGLYKNKNQRNQPIDPNVYQENPSIK